jgi:hypothetical protein
VYTATALARVVDQVFEVLVAYSFRPDRMLESGTRIRYVPKVVGESSVLAPKIYRNPPDWNICVPQDITSDEENRVRPSNAWVVPFHTAIEVVLWNTPAGEYLPMNP